MKLKYIGDQDEITIRETTFPKGKAVDVSDEALIAKLSVLPYFEEVKPKAKRNAKNK